MSDLQYDPLVTVIVTFYNQSHYIQRALESVLKQSYRNLQIIVVDDGSEISAEQDVLEFDDSRIQFVRKENGGVASARNLGVSISKGEYIVFLDGDDAYLPSKIQVLVSELRGRDFPRCAIVSGYYEVSSKGVLITRHAQKPKITHPLTDPISDFPDMRPSMVMYHHTILKELGGFPSELKINEDGAFNLRVFRRYPIICIQDILVLWQGDDEGKSRSVLRSFDTALHAMESKVCYLRKWLGDADADAYCGIYMRNNLCGFLSVGNLKGARKWFQFMCESDVTLDSFQMQMAIFSVKAHVNLYVMIRWLLRMASTFFLFGASWRLRHQLSLWSN
jgi:glycosyltransferase involved in cell wall biosynthesis